MEDLIDNFQKIVKEWDKFHSYGNPEIVILCSPKYYYEILRKYDNNLYYIKSDFENNINFISIMGIKTPILISKDLEKNTEYRLMLREQYEKEEKEKIYERTAKMFERRGKLWE